MRGEGGWHDGSDCYIRSNKDATHKGLPSRRIFREGALGLPPQCLSATSAFFEQALSRVGGRRGRWGWRRRGSRRRRWDRGWSRGRLPLARGCCLLGDTRGGLLLSSDSSTGLGGGSFLLLALHSSLLLGSSGSTGLGSGTFLLLTLHGGLLLDSSGGTGLGSGSFLLLALHSSLLLRGGSSGTRLGFFLRVDGGLATLAHTVKNGAAGILGGWMRLHLPSLHSGCCGLNL